MNKLIDSNAAVAENPFEPTVKSMSGGEAEVYQSVSRAAIASVILGVVGLTGFLLYPMLLISLTGMVFAFVAFSAIRKFPTEILGKPVATAGLSICLGSLILAPIYHTYVYLTEVPDGYERLDFALLKNMSSDPNAPPPPDALAYDGLQVFIKGYIHPSSMDTLMAKRFVIVPDLGTCCFGNQPPLTHMIEVNLTNDQYARKSFRRQRLAGTLRVSRNLKTVDGLTGVYYQLRADIIK